MAGEPCEPASEKCGLEICGPGLPLSMCVPNIPTQPASHLSPKYTYTACISFIPQIYLHCLHIIYPPDIPTLPAYHLSPKYTYTACISFIPQIYLHSLHLIYPPDIPTQPASHLSPKYTYTACISFIPQIYLHSLHLIYPPIQMLNHHQDSKWSSLQDI